jgi:hypothetical protein
MSLKESEVMAGLVDRGHGETRRGPVLGVCLGVQEGPANQDRRHDERSKTFTTTSARQSSREVNICRVLSKSCGVAGGLWV